MVYDELTHYGVLGMKWGRRRSQAQLVRARKKREIHDDYKNAHSKKSIKSMSNEELRNRNNRLNMEKQYKDLTKKTNHGEKAVKKYIAAASLITGAAAATGTFVKYGKPIANKIIEKSKMVWVL